VEYQVDYQEETPDNYLIQSILSYEFYKGFEIGTGANFKSFGGFKPLISLTYSKFGRNLGFVIQSSYELSKDGIGEIFGLFQWNPQNEKLIQPYLSIQALTAFKDRHVYSYQYLWLGAQIKSFQFGPALNIEQVGSDYETQMNIGIFLNINI